MATKREIILFTDEPVTASGQVIRSPRIYCGEADKLRLLVKVKEIGSPSSGESVAIRPIWTDKEGREFLDGNTTYGTFSLAGSGADQLVTVDIPSPGIFMALKGTGAGSLDASTGFKVSAWFVPISTIGE